MDCVGGQNSKEEARDMVGLKRSYEMMDGGISRVPSIRDSLSAAEGEFHPHVCISTRLILKKCKKDTTLTFQIVFWLTFFSFLLQA